MRPSSAWNCGCAPTEARVPCGQDPRALTACARSEQALPTAAGQRERALDPCPQSPAGVGGGRRLGSGSSACRAVARLNVRTPPGRCVPAGCPVASPRSPRSAHRRRAATPAHRAAAPAASKVPPACAEAGRERGRGRAARRTRTVAPQGAGESFPVPPAGPGPRARDPDRSGAPPPAHGGCRPVRAWERGSGRRTHSPSRTGPTRPRRPPLPGLSRRSILAASMIAAHDQLCWSPGRFTAGPVHNGPHG